MALKVKIFEYVFPDSATIHRSTFRDQIWWKSAVAKLPKGRLNYHTQHNSCSAGLVPAPILPKISRSRSKFPEHCHPLTCPRVPNLARIGYVCRTFPERFIFSAQKVNTINYRLSAYNKCSSTMYSPSVMEQTCVYVYLDVFQFIRNNPQCQSRMSNFVGRWTHIHCSLCK